MTDHGPTPLNPLPPGVSNFVAPQDATTPEGEADLAASSLVNSLVAIAGEDPMAAVAAPEAEAKPEPEASKDETPEPATAPAEHDDLSDDRPWTPERIKSAAAQIRSERAAYSRKASEVNAREARVKEDSKAAKALLARIGTDLQALRTGEGSAALDALGRMAQRDPHALYEEISLAVIGKKKNGTESNPQVTKLENELAEIKQLLTEGQKQKHADEKWNEHVAQTNTEIREVLADADFWPAIAARAKENPEQMRADFEQAYDYICQKSGKILDVQRVANIIEANLRKRSTPKPLSGAINQTPGSVPDEEQASARANPENATQVAAGRSLNPNLAAEAGASRREATDEERTKDFVRNPPPGFYESLGF